MWQCSMFAVHGLLVVLLLLLLKSRDTAGCDGKIKKLRYLFSRTFRDLRKREKTETTRKK